MPKRHWLRTGRWDLTRERLSMSGSLAIATTEMHVDHGSHSPVALTETEVLTLVATEILTRAGLRNYDALATI